MRFRSRISPRQQQLLQGSRRVTLAIAGLGILLLVWLVSRPSATNDMFGNGPATPAADTTAVLSGLQSDEIHVIPSQAAPLDATAVIDR
ncbi:MAG: hypothetical protein ACKO2P_18680 [Planctomycetota bacterium]